MKGRTWRNRQRRAALANKSISLADKSEYISLFQWAKKNGVIFRQLKPALFAGTGRGLMATSLIQSGDTLISVPRNMLITASMVKQKYFTGHTLDDAVRTIDLLCLFLIIQVSLGIKSFWFPYISMLPKQFNTSSYFSSDELESAPLYVLENYNSQISDIKRCLQSLKKLLKQVPDEIRDNVIVTFENVRWAWNVVNTRSVYMDGESCATPASCALAPLLDLLNHSCDVEVEAGFSQVIQHYGINTKTRFKKGNEVFINYGPHSNRKLLVEYGFILPSNCHSSITIDPFRVYSIIAKYCRVISKKKCTMIAKYHLEKTYSCSSNGLSWSLRTALKLLALEDAKLQQKCINIEDLELVAEDEFFVKLSSRSILESVFKDHNLSYSKIRSTFEERHVRSERINLLAELLKQETEIVRDALSHLKL